MIVVATVAVKNAIRIVIVIIVFNIVVDAVAVVIVVVVVADIRGNVIAARPVVRLVQLRQRSLKLELGHPGAEVTHGRPRCPRVPLQSHHFHHLHHL